ncbi:MAG: hypothetical protein ABI300_10820 [Rhodanobacter sp.]
MPSRNRDEQDLPANTSPAEDEQEPAATRPDESSTLSGTPSPNVTTNPRIKNN